MSAAKHEFEKLQEKLQVIEGLDEDGFEDEEQPEDEYVDLHQDAQTGEWQPRARIF